MRSQGKVSGYLLSVWLKLTQLFRAHHKPAAIRRLTYAIGDIHGRADLLEILLAAIERDRAGRAAELIFLGDYVDRGPESRAVIDRLLQLEPAGGIAPVFLKGNHEAAMLDFLADAQAGQNWAQWGGDETLMSYGVRPPLSKIEPGPWEEARAAFMAALPPAHLAFLNSLTLTAIREDYLFVHAGVDPDRPIEAQGAEEFLWIRDAFLSSRQRLAYTVVHGHTPEESPYHDHRRIGCDTGAYMSGALSVARLEGESVAFYQARQAQSRRGWRSA